MKTGPGETMKLGELIVTAFDVAALHSTDPREISRLATGAVMHMMYGTWMTLLPPLVPAKCLKAGAVS